jgi:hypothetical protein
MPRRPSNSPAAVPSISDVGALVAADRGERSLWAQFAVAVGDRRPIIVPSPVLTQAWRGGRTQARLAKLLSGCRVPSPDESLAKHAGVLLGLSKTTDAVDAIVVAMAIALRAAVVTSDVEDTTHLVQCADTAVAIPVSRV